MKTVKEIFIQRLKDVRILRGLSQDEMAQKLSVQRATYSHWENGRREPDLTSLSLIADIFNVSLDYLLGRSSENRS